MAGKMTRGETTSIQQTTDYWQSHQLRKTIARARDAMAICIDGQTGSEAFGACFDHGDGLHVHVIFRQLIQRYPALARVVRKHPGFFPATEHRLAAKRTSK